jgi:hypothetical protein
VPSHKCPQCGNLGYLSKRLPLEPVCCRQCGNLFYARPKIPSWVCTVAAGIGAVLGALLIGWAAMGFGAWLEVQREAKKTWTRSAATWRTIFGSDGASNPTQAAGLRFIHHLRAFCWCRPDY